MFNEMTVDEMMAIDGGLSNEGRLILAVGGAVVLGIAAPLAGAAVVGTAVAAGLGATETIAAVAGTVATTSALGAGMMTSAID